jgi:predicted adenine nucleotide alpha hydrolase (AANH) superfamily ATPase
MPDSIKQDKPKLLLHVCCIGCGAYVAQVLKEEYTVTLFFYNPSIFPREEYRRRKEETVRIADQLGLALLSTGYDHEAWLKLVRGFEQSREGGRRCLICYRDRLERTGELAVKKGFTHFGTTLTVSPHKLADKINNIGAELADKYGIGFISEDFKKQDGFKKACQLSHELKLYRQDYCGCEFSRR